MTFLEMLVDYLEGCVKASPQLTLAGLLVIGAGLGMLLLSPRVKSK